MLSKGKPDTDTQFIDASSTDFFKKETNNNVLLDEHIEKILDAFSNKTDIEHFAQSVRLETIVKNDYNLSVSSYVEPKDTREVIDIKKLNAELKTTVVNIDRLRQEIDTIIAEIDA